MNIVGSLIATYLCVSALQLVCLSLVKVLITLSLRCRLTPSVARFFHTAVVCAFVRVARSVGVASQPLSLLHLILVQSKRIGTYSATKIYHQSAPATLLSSVVLILNLEMSLVLFLFLSLWLWDDRVYIVSL